MVTARYLCWNPAAERLYGYPDDAIVGKSLSVLIPSSSQEALDVAQEQLVRGERIEQYETRHVRADGREVEVSLSISPIHGPAGRVTGATLIARDVTERRQAEEALRDSETRYRGMIEATFDGVAIQQDGVLVDVNQGFCEMFGCERSEAIGRSVLDFIAEEARETVL